MYDKIHYKLKKKKDIKKKMLSRLVMAFLPRSKHLIISWLQSPYAVIWEPPKTKFRTASIVPHLFAMKLWDQMP